MKNKFNLIEWLSRNSHEKQKPQRFARDAVMLMMLLTLGVGQMWGTNYLYMATSDAAGSSIATFDGSNNAYWVSTRSTETRFYVHDSNGKDYLNSDRTFNPGTQYEVWKYGDSNYGHSKKMTPVSNGVYRFSFWQIDGDKHAFKYQPYIIVGNGSGNWLNGVDWGTGNDTRNLALSSGKTYSNCPAGLKIFRIIPYAEYDGNHGYSQVTSCNVPYVTNEDNNVVFVTNTTANITISFDGSEISITVTPTDGSSAVKPYLKGDYVMFYFGDTWDDAKKWLNKSSAQDYYHASKFATINSTHRVAVGVAEKNISYFISNNDTWVGNKMSNNVAQGSIYNAANISTVTAGRVPSFNTTTPSVAVGTTASGLSASAGNSLIDNSAQTYSYYYSTDSENTWTEFDPTDVDDLAVGAYNVRALAYDGHIYTRTETAATLTVYAAITLNNHGADSGKEGTTSVNAVKGNTATAITAPEKTGYVFQGYYTSENGGGTQIIDETGAWLQNKSGYTDNSSPCKYNATTNSTLHAKWTATITPSAKYTTSPNGASYTTGTTGGTVTINGSSSATNVVEGATYTISATPAAGYIVESVDVGSTNIYSNTSRTSGIYNNSSQTADAAATVTVKFARVKDITVYIYTGTENSVTPDLVSVVMNGCTQYVGATSLTPITVNNYLAGNPKFTLSGNWLIYTFTNVSQVSGITCARNGGNIFTGTITDNVYFMYDGTELSGQCVPCSNPTWGTAPASGAIGGSMTATVSGAPDGATITWSSTATSYATVNSSGVISYEAAGSATIKANVSWDASGDYCSGSYELSQAITVTSGATVSATRTSPAYVASGVNGQVSLSITSTGATTGWKYRIKNKGTGGYYDLNNIDASGNSTTWTMSNASVGTGSNTLVVELYNASAELEATSSDISVTGEIAYNTTISAGSNGSVSPNGTVYANNSNVHPSITATANTNYHFVDWTSNNAAASVASTTSATTSVTATAGGYTITANFAGDQYTITYYDQGGSAFLGTQSEAPATHTYGTATDLKIPTKTGYAFGGWYTASDCASGAVGDANSASLGATAYTDNITLYAKWTENLTTVTINANPAGAGTFTVDASAFTPGNTTTAGVATSRTVVATAHNDYTFGSWSVTGNATGTNSTNTYTLKGNGSAGTGTLTANFTLVPCSLYYGSSTPLNSPSSAVMSYDLEEQAYYIDVTTNSSPYYFRFLRDSKQWCGDWTSYPDVNAVTANGSKVACATETQGWDNKGSVKYTGEQGSKIRIWFDYQNKKTWITASEDKHYVLRGSQDGGGDPDSGMPGWSATTSYFDGLASGNTGTIEVTLLAGTKYKLKAYDMFNAAWKGNNKGSGTQTMADNTLYTIGTGDNFVFTSTAAGPYTFTLDKTSGLKIKVKFPTSYQVDFSSETFVNGGASHSTSTTGGTLAAVDGDETTFTSGSKIISGGTVVITATKADGYTFDGFFTNAACTTAVSGAGVSISDNVLTLSSITAAKTVYAKFSENMTSVTLSASPAGKGTFQIGGATVTSTSAGVTTKPSVTAVAGTGYHLTGTIWSKDNSNITLSSTTTNPTTVTGCGTSGTSSTLTATFTPITYTIRFNGRGNTSGSMSNQTSIAYDASTNITTNAFVKTGYNFAGWATTAERAAAGTVDRADGAAHGNLSSTHGAIVDLYAVWTPKQSALTLDKQTSATGYGSAGTATASAAATYGSSMPALTGTLPTAAEGYAFMGFYDATGGGGTQYYDGTGASVTNWDKDTEDGTTLYAYYKKAEITDLVATPSVIAPSETITITPTISPAPTGTTKVCYELQYSNGTPLPSQPEFSSAGGNAVSFPVPSASATYIIQATLAKGSSCPADPGDVLSTRTTTFQVAGEHTVTIRYQDSDGRTLQASEVLEEIRPLTWSEDITAPTITGYTFARWDAGDGVTIKDGSGEDKTTSTSSTIKIKAVYDGTLTAVYNKKNMIFFNNTLGWDDVYVYFYTSNKYWDDSYGTGAYKGKVFDGNSQFWDMHYGQMTQIEGTDIWYFDYTAQGWDGWANVAFANMDKAYSGEDNTSDNAKAFFSYTTSDPIQVVRRGDHNTSLPMFVPLSGQPGVKRNENRAVYYSEGYWMNYPENTGYVLHVYNGTTYGASDQMQEIPFEFNEDKTLPMSIKVELNAGRTYGFEIHRADGTVLGENEYTLQSGDSGDDGETVRTLGTGERSKITTAVAGDYIFTLNFGNSGGYKYFIGVHYPVTTGDYRILYTDDAAWSKGAHSPEYVWSHDSRTIHKENGATDIVSFYVKYDLDTKMKFQYVSGINASTGAVTWTDVTSGDIDLSSIKKDGVYNFHLTQSAGAISVEKIEPYTGKYYIRTDCAGATKWENFRTTDHEMTYSDYAEENSGYSHYFAHWVTQYTNVKFCIANDYSLCISDTLTEDYGTVIADISSAGALNSANANIRFMWNQSTNKISRAYIGGSGTITDRFLVLEGDTKMYDENGNALTGDYQDHDQYGTYLATDNQVILHDDENFVYERTVKVNASARAKLTAKYNSKVQYFKGGEGDFAEGTTVQLLGGTYDAEKKYSMRIVYDFKTNRLVTAYVPSGTIEDDLEINADLMIVREHQEAGQQLLFNGGSLSEVHTVYGVMRFNRWTLNNKETTGSHDPVGDPKSAYERGLYWISFPFDVNLSDVFGFGTYGTHWIIMEYDGAERASKGYWKDSDGFWKYVTNRTNKVLKAGKGYVLALDLDLMRDNDGTFWSNNIEQVELFFPSAAEVNNISETNVQTTVDSHECTINRHTQAEQDAGTDTNINKNRTKADSHWNMIGIPSYANYGTTLKDGAGGSTITWNSNPYTNDLPFLYEWNMVDNTYTVQSGTTYPFKSMHAYMVQYHGNLYWSLASATPVVSPIVARRTYAEKPQNVEMRLELSQNEKKVDQTFVKLSNDENVSTNFSFDEDLCKEYNGTKANIYTFIEGYIPAGGNTLPMTEQTIVVPVGVQIAANGDYTFAIPEGTNGVGVTLIDNETGIRTSLSALDYTINLPAGTYNERFLLEISPIRPISTDLENTEYRIQNTDVRKVLIDNILYIVKDGVMYDARGARVQ